MADTRRWFPYSLDSSWKISRRSSFVAGAPNRMPGNSFEIFGLAFVNRLFYRKWWEIFGFVRRPTIPKCVIKTIQFLAATCFTCLRMYTNFPFVWLWAWVTETETNTQTHTQCRHFPPSLVENTTQSFRFDVRRIQFLWCVSMACWSNNRARLRVYSVNYACAFSRAAR